MGGQTGTEQLEPELPPEPSPGSPTNGGEHGSACEATAEPIDEADESLGFSASEVFAFALGESESELRWYPPPSAVSFGPELGVVALDVGISLRGNLRKVHFTPKAVGGAGPAIAIVCPPTRLEADVELELATASGALAERIPAVLTSSHPELAEIRASLELADVAGSFDVTTSPGVSAGKLEIQALLSPYGQAGQLSSGLTSDHGMASSHSRVVYGRWPADEGCTRENLIIPVPTSAPPAEALRSAVERLGEVDQAPLDWLESEPATVTLSVETGSVACLGPNSMVSGLVFELPLSVHVETSDGRVNTTLPATLSSEAGSVASKVTATRRCEGATQAEQELDCGISGFALGDASSLGVWMNATVTDQVSGTLSIVGVRPIACEPTPSSACPGRGAEALETGEF